MMSHACLPLRARPGERTAAAGPPAGPRVAAEMCGVWWRRQRRQRGWAGSAPVLGVEGQAAQQADQEEARGLLRAARGTRRGIERERKKGKVKERKESRGGGGRRSLTLAL